MPRYDHKKIEKKWRQLWQENKIYRTKDLHEEEQKTPSFYCLVEFPYPSGNGLHVGHVRGYTAMDIIARKKRAEGLRVLFPMGWDAFGLPTENYSIKTGIHPREVTRKNTDTFREQMMRLGFSFDWDREINTSDPAYYRWTQWIFLRMFEKGLAYKASMPINWCPSCKIGLANEEAQGGVCERCGGETETRIKEQWMLAITRHAERLLKNLDALDFPDEVKRQQKNWIGKSEGAQFTFPIKPKGSVQVFTTRPDTFFGVTYIALSPTYPLVKEILPYLKNKKEVESYQKKSRLSARERDISRGIKLEGAYAVHPGTQEKVPLYCADYVLSDYGTGAVMGVPAHDSRDFEFARAHGIKIKKVVLPMPVLSTPRNAEDIAAGAKISLRVETECYEGKGELIDSGKYTRLLSDDAAKKIMADYNAKKVITYRLRDWVFSRQRYWGEPIPLVFCSSCAEEKEFKSEGERLNPGWIPLPDDDLPLELPDIDSYVPAEDGSSPLARLDNWIDTPCPRCGRAARRETDVMPNWAGSSWYFLRYIDPQNTHKLVDRKKAEDFMPVDWYNGGMEHVTLHLLYSRFWNQFLYDIGVSPVEEPYIKRTSHGMILGEGGVKMSKSKGNVINPDDVAETYGADTLRVYEMFMGPYGQRIAWSSQDIVGVRKFIERLFSYVVEHYSSNNKRQELPEEIYKAEFLKTISKITHDIETMRFNTAVAQMMIFLNLLRKNEITGVLPIKHMRDFIRVIAPFAPFISEELWNKLGGHFSVHQAPWPAITESTGKLSSESLIVIQVNGKKRTALRLPSPCDKETAVNAALADEKILRIVGDQKNIAKIIYVPERLLNIVLKGKT